jgi:hypothetical protein
MAATDQAQPRQTSGSDKITDALATRRALGVRLGGPRSCPDEVLARIVACRMEGEKLVDIASALNADAVPTPGGGLQWYPSHLSRLLRTQDAQLQFTRAESEKRKI